MSTDAAKEAAGVPLLRLLQLTSPSLPIGAFAYSQGLEQAVADGWVTDESSAEAWIVGLLRRNVGGLDLPVVARIHAAALQVDATGARAWNAFLLASRGSAELRAEERHLGTALGIVLERQGLAVARSFFGGDDVSYAGMFAFGASCWGVPRRAAVAGYAFAWTELQVASATRLCPLGQTSAQTILSRALPVIDEISGRALSIPDEAVGASAPAQVIASARHETLYSRLCRS